MEDLYRVVNEQDTNLPPNPFFSVHSHVTMNARMVAGVDDPGQVVTYKDPSNPRT